MRNLIVIFLLLWCLPVNAATTTTLTKDEITWTFAIATEYGQFINGDYWVIDSGSGVDVIDILPGYQYTTDVSYLGQPRYINGSMLNSTKSPQGFDSVRDFSADRNVDVDISSGNPLHLVAGDALISSKSYPAYGTSANNSYVDKAAVLTVLSTIPPADAFRPQYTVNPGGTAKTIYRMSDVNFDILSNHEYAGKPDPTATLANTSVLFLHRMGWTARFMHPQGWSGTANGNYYWPNQAIGPMALMLNLDYSLSIKQGIAIRLLQLGIDFFGTLKESPAGWLPNAGSTSGNKLPILYAALMLDDAEMKSYLLRSGNYYLSNGYSRTNPPTDRVSFNEDTPFYVDQYMIDLTNSPTWKGYIETIYGSVDADTPYSQAMLGMPEWGSHNDWKYYLCNSEWDTTYRSILTGGGGYFVQSAIAARMIQGGEFYWNNPAFFDYIQRYVAIARGQADPFGYVVANEETSSLPSTWTMDVYDAVYLQMSCSDGSQYCKNDIECAENYPTYNFCNGVCQEAECYVPPVTGAEALHGGSCKGCTLY
jgi:hypothetical protein